MNNEFWTKTIFDSVIILSGVVIALGILKICGAF